MFNLISFPICCVRRGSEGHYNSFARQHDDYITRTKGSIPLMKEAKIERRNEIIYLTFIGIIFLEVIFELEICNLIWASLECSVLKAMYEKQK